MISLPDQFLISAGASARELDSLTLALLAMSLFFLLLIGTLLIVFIVKYRHSEKNPRAHLVPTRTAVEICWTLVPLIITVVAFGWGAQMFLHSANAPAGASSISVLARQWMWKFRSLDGIEEINELHLPANRAYQLTMISQDVIHSFYVPQLRVKYDVLPGRYTQVWFQPDRIGTYPILCTQYCGTDHSKMVGHLVIMSGADYQAWAKKQTYRQTMSMRQQGEQLFREKACVSCHDTGATIGPDLGGVAGHWVALSGKSDPPQIFADDDYLRDSILNPSHHITRGFRDVMPSFRGQLSEEQLVLLLTYIKSLSPKAKAGEA